MSSRGVKDGEEWIVNGQKVWTTLAHVSKWGLLVVRTDPETVKHAGLTAFVVDMEDPTVETRPLRQMTGEAEFNEVYFTDTRVPDAEMLGKPGDGWRVSLTTLMNERTSIGGAIPAQGSGTIADLMNVWAELPDDRKDLPVKRQGDGALIRAVRSTGSRTGAPARTPRRATPAPRCQSRSSRSPS
ncbi:MAG: acyl-CoA dehydrogenase family protein [Ilumatobacteraceae bacterium]